MDREKLLQMAEESGLLAGYEGEPDRIARFAELVRADENGERNSFDLAQITNIMDAVRRNGSNFTNAEILREIGVAVTCSERAQDTPDTPWRNFVDAMKNAEG